MSDPTIVLGVPVLAIAALLVALLLVRRRKHSRGMGRFRAACRELGLERGDEMWARSDGRVRVGARTITFNYTTHGSRSLYRGRANSYLAKIDPPLSLGLVAFRRTTTNMIRRDGYEAFVEHWRQSDLPPRLVLAPDPHNDALKIHAADDARASRTFTSPDVVTVIREAIEHSTDVRLADDEVELLGDPYEADPTEIDRKLRLAANLARALSTNNAA